MMCFFSFIRSVLQSSVRVESRIFSAQQQSESLSLLDHFLLIAALTIVVSFELGQQMFQAIRTIIRIRSAIGKSPFNGNGDVKGKDTDGYLGNIAIVFLFFLTLSGVSAFTMFTTSGLFIDVWANLLIAMGLLIVAQRIILQRLGTFRTVHNKLRAKVGEFSQENDKLHNEIDNLEIESSK